MITAGKHFLSVLFCMCFLNGCAHFGADVPQSRTWLEHQGQLKQISTYQVSGKFAYKDKLQAQSAYFVWQQQGESTKLKLTNFLGMHLMTLTITSEGAKLVTRQGEQFTDKDPQHLLKRLTGMDMAVHMFQFWLKGLATAPESLVLTPQQTAASFIQRVGSQPIQLSYQDYKDIKLDSQLVSLPHKISIRANDLFIKMLISGWSFDKIPKQI